MPDWTNPINGSWTDPTRWTGAVPNAPGAVANFTSSSASGAGNALIAFAQDETVTVGTLSVVTDGGTAFAFLGGLGVTQTTLRFQGAGGGPAGGEGQ